MKSVFRNPVAGVAFAALVLLGVATSCDQAPLSSYLTPTGGDGTMVVSEYTAIQVVGDFNGFNAGAPTMTFDGTTGVWSDTLTVQVGCYLMKFRTNNDWDETPDFGRCSGSETDCEVQVPVDGTPLSGDVCAVTGSGTAIGQVEFVESGSYLFELDEPNEVYRISRLASVGSISGTVAFTGPRSGMPVATITVYEGGTQSEVVQTSSSPDDGSFLVENLTPGTYDLTASAGGFESATVEDIAVVAFQVTDVGTLTLVPGCSYGYTDMQVVGDFNGFDQNAPSMSQIGNCAWADTLTIAAGCYYMKFRTNGDWDATPDFGRCTGSEGPCQITVPLGGTALEDSVCAVTGSGTAIGQVEFLANGDYEFVLDESGPAFRIRSLAVIPTGSISGTADFSDSPSTSPTVTVTVFDAGTTNVQGTATTNPPDDTFTVPNVAGGTYDVRLRAPNYADSVVTGVVVTPPNDTDIGTITLTKTCTSSFTSIDVQLVGLLAVIQVPLTQVESCVWADTLALDPDCYGVRFPTSNPLRDYRRCSGLAGLCETPIPTDGTVVTGTTCVRTSGDLLGEFEVLVSGSYEIILDEGAAPTDQAVYRIRKLP